LAPTSGELIRPPSASCDLRHTAEENFFRARGCTAATGCQLGHTARSSNSKEEGYKYNTPGGGAIPEDKGSRSYPSTGRKEERKCFVFPIYRRRSMKLLKKYVILPKMTRTEGLHKESFVKTIPTMMMIGMTSSITEILLLMTLLLYQQNCRLPHGPIIQATSAPHV
jgi:hypothetical protein